MIRIKFFAYLFTVSSTLMLISGCRAKTNSELASAVNATSPKFCAALRGNGQYIFTHFGALARITEEYGMLDGVAGGSSASLTSFLYESMRSNPILKKYSDDEKKLKLSLMLKSVLGYLEALKGGDEFLTLAGVLAIGEQLAEKGVDEVDSVKVSEAKVKLSGIFSDPNLKQIINPEIFAMLSGSDNPPYKSMEFKIEEIKLAAKTLSIFKADDQKLLFREGLISFKTVVELFARIADFYAASTHVNETAMESFLNQCGDSGSRGLNWSQIANLDRGGKKCGEIFKDLVSDYRSKLRKNNFVTPNSRLDDPLGKTIDSIIFSGFVENDPQSATTAPQDFLEALKRFRKGEEPAYKVDFENVRFGYWTSDAWRPKIAASVLQNDDAKTKKYRSLSQNALTWREILPFSIMEPGFGRMRAVGDNKVFIGGWADLHPIQPLKAAGCDEVIYVTRQGPESDFVTDARPLTPTSKRLGVAELLNLTETQQRDLYSSDNKDSSYSKAVRMADAVWCTDWESLDASDFNLMFNHSYDSSIAPKTSRFKQSSVVGIMPAPKLGCY